MEIEILNQNGSEDSKVLLADGVFNQEFNQDLVHQLVNTYIHNSHQRTKGQKNRSAVRGGGKKPWKQKGTGRARAGTIRSPIWRGGGMTFAHVYSDIKPKKINKKMYRSAMRSIWSMLADEGRLVVVNELKIDEPVKSSQVKTILSDLNLNSALFVLSANNDNLVKASKNLKECKVQTVNSLDPSALIQADDMGTTFTEEDIPEDLLGLAEEWREKMVESAAEANEEIMDKYLEEGDLSQEDIKTGIRIRTLANEIVPCLCGSAFKNKGVQTMLDAVVDFLPAPNEVKAVTGILDNEEEGSRDSDDAAPFAGIAFKIATDPFVGSLTFVRVYSGVLSTGDSVYLPIKGKKERIGRMLQMHSNKRDEISEARAGDICAVIGLKEAITGETLCDEKNKITLESMNFPEPVISVAVEPKTKEDQEKMGVALGRLAQEDPSFRLRTDEESGQTIMSGMGELHLDVLVDRMRREFGVDANVGKPQVAYRESIRKYVEEEAKFVRQSGGRGQYGHVYIKMEPLDEQDEDKDQNYQFVNEIVGGAIPREFIGAVDKGCREQMEAGVIAGYPLVKVKVTLYDGSYHDVDSSEVAFKVAGSMAFKGGAEKADPVLLEPIMSIEIVTPEEYMGDVVGDLSRRRGVVHGMEDGPSGKIVSGEVPLAEMFGYATDIRSASQGRATFTMEPLKYSEVPSNVAEAIINKND